MKYAAMTTGGYVRFTFEAANSTAARSTVQSLRQRSDTITGVRKFRDSDLGEGGCSFIPHRGGSYHAMLNRAGELIQVWIPGREVQS